MGEMLKQLKIAPERVLIETYAEQSGELPPPAEIMDGDDVAAMPETKEAIMVNHPPVHAEDKETVSEADDAKQTKEFLAGLKEDGEQLKKPYDPKVEGEGYKKPGTLVPDTVPETPKPLMVNNPPVEDHGVELPKEAPIQDPIQSPQNKAVDMPENFFEFMTKAKAMLKKAEKEDMYKDALHTYSIKVLSDVKDDQKKQGDVRAYVEALLEEEGVI
jgi:hypothetical protein